MIFIYSDVVFKAGGIETYLHALAIHLKELDMDFRVAVSEQEPSPIVDDLVARNIRVYRQAVLPGDRWHVRKRALIAWLYLHLKKGDWVFCVRQPMPEIYLMLVRAVHARGAKIAASWIFEPRALKTPPKYLKRFVQAIELTDAVVSVANCTAHQFKEVYGYEKQVHVVNYHNLRIFDRPVPLPTSAPIKIGYMGRIEIFQKNLDFILAGFRKLVDESGDAVELHIYGGGPDETEFRSLVQQTGLIDRIFVHGPYDHRQDLKRIISSCHLFLYPSRFEGGPCLALLELLQAGRYVITSRVGGIPDIYEGHPEFGLMIDPQDSDEFVRAVQDGMRRIREGDIDQMAMHSYYENRFGMSEAHKAWVNALGMDELSMRQ